MSEGIGARVLRKEDKRFITGKGRYTDDIVEANQAYAAFVRSPHAHARIVSIDTTKAMEMEGVETVLMGPELVAKQVERTSMLCHTILKKILQRLPFNLA